MHLCLIRHFAPGVAPGICYGQTDLILKTSVLQDAARVEGLRKQLASRSLDDAPVFSSSLQRCSALASALSSDATEDARLRELDFGAWEMQTWDAIGAEALDAWASDIAGFRPPNGETGYELQRRALDWLREVSASHDRAIVVTHAGIMRVLQAHHQMLPSAEWLTLRYEYGEMVCMDFTAEQIHATPVQ